MTAGEASRYKEVHCATRGAALAAGGDGPCGLAADAAASPGARRPRGRPPLLRPSLCASPRLRDLVDAALALLHYAAAARRASKALRALCAEEAACVASLATARAMEKLRLLLRAATAPPPPLRVSTSASIAGGAAAATPSTGGGGGVGGVDAPLASSASGLLGFLVESIADEWLTPSEEAAARADELLGLCGETHEADASQELLDALLRLQARGVGCSGAALEAQLRAHALQLLHGLTVLAWVDRTDAALPPPMHAPLAALLGVPEWRATDVLRDLAAQYCAERLYLQRLRIVKLAMLCAPAREHVKVTTVGAAWRPLSIEDGKAQAAVLEVLDSVLPTQLKKIILPLLDASPAAEKVRGGRESFEELRAVRHQRAAAVDARLVRRRRLRAARRRARARCATRSLLVPGGAAAVERRLAPSRRPAPRDAPLPRPPRPPRRRARPADARAHGGARRALLPRRRVVRDRVGPRAPRRRERGPPRRHRVHGGRRAQRARAACTRSFRPSTARPSAPRTEATASVSSCFSTPPPGRSSCTCRRSLRSRSAAPSSRCPPPSHGGRRPPASAKAITTLQEARRSITDAAADGARASAGRRRRVGRRSIFDESERTSTDADGDDAEAEAEAEHRWRRRWRRRGRRRERAPTRRRT